MTRGKRTHAKSEIAVIGAGEFPIDMLRYDRCVPRSSVDSGLISGDAHEVRVVRLEMFSEGRPSPEYARWRSYGWAVLLDDEESAIASKQSTAAAVFRDKFPARVRVDSDRMATTTGEDFTPQIVDLDLPGEETQATLEGDVAGPARIDLDSGLVTAIEAYLGTTWDDGRDPSKLGAINAVCYIGERVAEIYRATSRSPAKPCDPEAP